VAAVGKDHAVYVVGHEPHRVRGPVT
jgi:hypothetical protein